MKCPIGTYTEQTLTGRLVHLVTCTGTLESFQQEATLSRNSCISKMLLKTCFILMGAKNQECQILKVSHFNAHILLIGVTFEDYFSSGAKAILRQKMRLDWCYMLEWLQYGAFQGIWFRTNE